MTTKVLTIIGSDRSGSTLLDNILGGIPGAFSGGEIRYLWERGLGELRLCGCGARVVDCDIWAKVLERVPAEATETATVLDDLELLRTRHAFTPRLPAVGRRYDARVREIARKIAPIYHELAAVTGAEVLIDSSKRPTWAHLLAMMPGVELSVLHLIRDPRAVAHSRQRFKKQLYSAEERGMPQHPPVISATFWTVWNVAGEPFASTPRYFRLRYEDLLADPIGSVDAVRAMVGLDDPHPTLTRNTVELAPSHTVSGNPGRFRTGVVELRSDDAWRRDQQRKDRLVVDALTWPLARRYGYQSLRESGAQASSARV
jgi:hypothetical protein